MGKYRGRFLVWIMVLAALLALGFAYNKRENFTYRFSSLVGDREKSFHESEYARHYRDADRPTDISNKAVGRIMWDLWLLNIQADIGDPKKKGGLIFIVVDATDRTDTRFVYVFSESGELIEFAQEPLA